MNKLAAQVNNEHGVVDILVNNAGIGMAGRFLETTPANWDDIMAVNLRGVLNGSRAFGDADGRPRRGRHHHQRVVGRGVSTVEVDDRLRHDQGRGAGVQRITARRPGRRGHHRHGGVPGIRQHEYRQKHRVRRYVGRRAGARPATRPTLHTGVATTHRKPPPRRSSRPSRPARRCCRSRPSHEVGYAMRRISPSLVRLFARYDIRQK